ncbi:MAG TPA: DUF2147 domain-containing protein [Chitinophagaceae bacterium]
MKIKFLLLVVLVLFSQKFYSQVSADDIIGVWLTAGKEPAKIEIYKSGDKYFGKIIWLKNPVQDNKSRVDANNPDRSKRSQPIIGLIILKDFKFDGDEWESGKIYDPESGDTYSCYLTLKDKTTLKVRGYIGISLFGRTETWIRTK